MSLGIGWYCAEVAVDAQRTQDAVPAIAFSTDTLLADVRSELVPFDVIFRSGLIILPSHFFSIVSRASFPRAGHDFSFFFVRHKSQNPGVCP